MRKTPNLDVERYRVREGEYASLRADGNNGLFVIPAPINNTGQPLLLLCVVSDGAGWEHVSVSVKVRLFNGRLREAERHSNVGRDVSRQGFVLGPATSA